MTELIPTYLALLRAGGFSRHTVRDRSRLLRHADGHLPYGLNEASSDEWAAYLDVPRFSIWTRHTYFWHGFGYYEWAVNAGELTLNPMGPLIRPPTGAALPDPVTDAELAQALALSPRQPWGMAVMLAAYAGLRCAELARLRRQDVTEERIRIRGGKGGHDAFVETCPVLWAYVRDELPGQLVRSIRLGRPMTPGRLTSIQAAHWRQIGLPEVHLHRFRHWYGTALLKAGVDLRTIQELMRHRSITSTQIYTQVVDEQRRLAIRTLPVPTTAALQGTAA